MYTLTDVVRKGYIRDPSSQHEGGVGSQNATNATEEAHCGVLNAFTVDLEDWAHGLLGGETKITRRVVRNTDRMLSLLARHRIQATFFVLGKVCEVFPGMLSEVAAAGHEIASHGYGHDLVFNITPQKFRDDLQRSIELIEQQTGRRPIGYRAPAFSITKHSLWAGPILAELGFAYSSSIFPFNGPRYGIAEAPMVPFRWQSWLATYTPDVPKDALGDFQEHFRRNPDWDLIEFPPAVLQLGRRRLPVGGGGYLRLLPVCFLAWAMRRINRDGHSATVYMHPYEMDITEIRELYLEIPIGPKTALKQSLFRRRIQPRLEHLFGRFRFTTLESLCKTVCTTQYETLPESGRQQR